MTSYHNGHRKGPARANTERLISSEYYRKTISLLKDFRDIPILNFASFWDIKYEESVDFVKLGHPEGLVGFLRDNSSLFELIREEDGILRVSLISRPISPDGCGERVKENLDSPSIAKQRAMGNTIDRLFDHNNYLWANKPWARFLGQKDISIASSAYELALEVDKTQAISMIKQFRAIFEEYPPGIFMTDLYKLIDVNEALRTFKCSISISTLVDELPEIFYHIKIDQRDVLKDGFKHTIRDLTGQGDALFVGTRDPDLIATDAINSGMYQKTLLLIRETGQIKGLKINVWHKSIEESFYPKNKQEFERDIARFSPLTFFLALARYDLVELKSSAESKNDIRAHLPRNYIDLVDLKATLPNLCDPDSNSESLDDGSKAQMHCVPKNRHAAAILKSKN